MTTQNIDTPSEEEIMKNSEESPIKRGRGRPKIDPSKLKVQGEYFNNYYHEKIKNETIQCINCGVMVSKNCKSKHIKSMKCQLKTLIIENQKIYDNNNNLN